MDIKDSNEKAKHQKPSKILGIVYKGRPQRGEEGDSDADKCGQMGVWLHADVGNSASH